MSKVYPFQYVADESLFPVKHSTFVLIKLSHNKDVSFGNIVSKKFKKQPRRNCTFIIV